MTQPHRPFLNFNSLPEIIRTSVLAYVKLPLSLRYVEDLLAEPGIEIRYGTMQV